MSDRPIVSLYDAAVFQANRLILRNINLNIQPGEFVYLIGKTGSGKSSLLKLLYAALPLRQGKGRVLGFDLGQLNRRSIPKLRRQLGIVFQDFNLLPDRSVADNLRFVLKATDWKRRGSMQERLEAVLESVGLQEVQKQWPHQLSGGEQQRLAIARALLNRPPLIIADEPTGNLDPETSESILQLLRELSKAQHTAVLFATHDYRLIENFPARTLRCENGLIGE